MSIDSLKSALDDLAQAEPRSIGSDSQALDAGAWVEMARKTEAEADAQLDPAIKEAFAAHKKLTGAKKGLMATFLAAKDRVRVGLANWIAGGRPVEGYYIKSKWRVTVKDEAALPSDYKKTVADQEALDAFATLTEGKVGIPGCTIDQINILYSKAEKP